MNASTRHRPFILQFAQKCTSPGRHTPSDEQFYDAEISMTRYGITNDAPLLIDVPDPAKPTTKKCDVEKGEDQKDRRMWR